MRIDIQGLRNIANGNRWGVGLLVFGALLCGLVGTVIPGRGAISKAVSRDTPTPLAIPDPIHLSSTFASIVGTVEPAVVNISTTQVHRSPKRPQDPRGFDEGPSRDFWNHFFHFPDMGPMTEHSLGSGVIVDKKGYILTNDHVVNGATKIQVQLSEQSTTKYAAKVVGTDEETDLAVLKIDADRELPVAKLGNSDGVRVGDWALAIGSPFGLRATVTAGIISAKNRNGIGRQFQRFLQTDAAINPGNSGGPLVDMAGQVIGINTAIETQSGGYQGVGFALPSNTAINVYNDLVAHGKVTRGSIGAGFQEEQSSPMVLKDLGATYGIVIQSVEPGSPASRAGLKGGDVITAVNGNPVKTGNDLVEAITRAPIGSQVEISYIRDRKERKVSVTVEARDQVFSGNSSTSGNSASEESSPVKFGLHVEALSPERARHLGMEGQRGVVVAGVDGGSFAEDIGFQQGDVIVEVNERGVESYGELGEQLGRLHAGDEVVFKVLRQGENRRLLTVFLAGTIPA
jgi:serine protease Do